MEKRREFGINAYPSKTSPRIAESNKAFYGCFAYCLLRLNELVNLIVEPFRCVELDEMFGRVVHN